MAALPPSRQPSAGGGSGAHASPMGGADIGASGEYGGPGSRAPVWNGDRPDAGASVAAFFADALDSALMLVHADGGELATLDDTRQALVLRSRRRAPLAAQRSDPGRYPSLPGAGAHPSLPLSYGAGFGAPARNSQPRSLSYGTPSHPSQPLLNASYGRMPFPQEGEGVKDELRPLDEIATQMTELLPAALNTRAYHRGERLIGYCWQRAEPVILRGEECRALPGGSAPADEEAPWHLAVPIFAPGALSAQRPATEVIGVISVFNRDPLWSFSPRDVELLTLHADRVALAMRLADLARQNQSQAELLDVLAAEVGASGERQLYARLRDVVRRTIDAPSFAVILFHPRYEVVTFEIAERDGHPDAAGRMPASALPPWWTLVRQGQSVRVSAPEERAARPDLCVLGWGGDAPAQSLLAAPLIFHNTLLGALVAGSPRADVYAPEHSRVFASIANSAAILIQNARLAEETRGFLAKTHAKERQLAVLNNATLTLNASLDLDTTVDALVQQASHLTDAKVCAVLLFDETRESLVGRASNLAGDDAEAAQPRPLRGRRIPLMWQGIGDSLKSGQFLVLTNLEGEWTDDTEVGVFLREQRLRSCLSIPLIHKENALGVLLVYTPGQQHPFQSEEIGLLQGLASQAAVAISNATLFAELQQAYALQKELDRLKDEFILTVSHEFRTPVTAIEGYVTLISRHGHKLDQGKLDLFAAEIRSATNQLMGMVDMLRDANNMSVQPLQLVTVPTDLRAAAEKAVASQSPEAKARIMLDLPSDLWVMGDAERLPHVFSNLLSNAIKYSPAHLPCHVTARIETREALAQAGRPHTLGQDAAERWVVVSVRDQGEGIMQEDQPKLFIKFMRLPRSLTTSVRGTGLGLWICKQYLDAMGGDIWVESEYGHGAQFLFALPLAVAPLERATT